MKLRLKRISLLTPQAPRRRDLTQPRSGGCETTIMSIGSANSDAHFVREEIHLRSYQETIIDEFQSTLAGRLQTGSDSATGFRAHASPMCFALLISAT
jgi:hypothetical protein